MKNISLSKSLYMDGLRCPRLLFLKINRADLAEPLDPQTQYLFETGHRVEEYARQAFPGGTLIGHGHTGPFAGFLAETEEVLRSDAPFIYEAAFATNCMHCRTDILNRMSEGRWGLAEIKMCTRVKPELVDDIAFQVCCMRAAGHTVDRAHLLHIYKEYVRHGEIEPTKLFASVDLTKDVNERSINVPSKVNSLIELVQEPVPPQATIGTRCKNPGKCPFYQYCHGNIPEGSVYELPYGAGLIPALLAKGITRLADIPSTIPLSERQSALVRSARLGRPVINVGVIKRFLQQLKYPVYFLDFETINSCIPPYNNSSPYERLPFQFSLHVQQTKGGPLNHFEFLAESTSDPRQRICEELIGLLGTSGSIAAWNASFEKGALTILAERFPEHAGRVSSLLGRFVDLMIPFKSGAYTDYRCQGSASIKKVLPVLVPGLSYENLAIGKGEEAALLFQKFVDGQMTNVEFAAIQNALLSYCCLDTQACVQILDVLHKLS